MRGLWRKDLPWLLVLGLGGAVTLALVAADHGFLRLFVVSPGRLENVFYTAAAMGLFVGAFAGVWDDLLGTREFLVQRPVAPSRLRRAPVVAALLVVASWTALTPPLAWLLASLWSQVLAPTYWAGVPEILGAVAIAWPAAAVGAAAVCLPVAWWQRVLFGAALALSVGYLVDAGSQRPDGYASPALYLVGCCAATVVAAAIAVRGRAARRDPDLPWSSGARLVCGSACVAATALTLSMFAPDLQRIAIGELQRAYPDLVRLDGEVVLCQRVPDDWRSRVRCDAQHRPVGPARPADDFEDVDRELRYLPRLFEIEAPRWHRHGLSSRDYVRDVVVYLDHRGNTWAWLQDEGRIVPVAIGGPEPLGSELSLRTIDDATAPRRPTIALGDRDAGRLWRFDVAARAFEPWPLPDGDRFVAFRTLRRPDGEDLSVLPTVAALFEDSSRYDLDYIGGAAGRYVVRDGALAAIELPELPERSRSRPRREVRIPEHDAMTYRVEVAADGPRAAFEHQFTPRTAIERLHAGHAMFWSLLRAPALQVPAFLRSGSEPPRTTSLLDDHLLRGGARPWLLALCLLVGVAAALLVRRRLRRLGADAATVGFWTIAVAATGVAGLVVCRLCTPARAYRRPPIEPPSPPRILTVVDREEVPA